MCNLISSLMYCHIVHSEKVIYEVTFSTSITVTKFYKIFAPVIRGLGALHYLSKKQMWVSSLIKN